MRSMATLRLLEWQADRSVGGAVVEDLPRSAGDRCMTELAGEGVARYVHGFLVKGWVVGGRKCGLYVRGQVDKGVGSRVDE